MDMVDSVKHNTGQIERDLRKDSSVANEPSPSTAATPNRQETLKKTLAGSVVPKGTPKLGETTVEKYHPGQRYFADQQL